MALEEIPFNRYMASIFAQYGSDYDLIRDRWNELHKDSTPRILGRLITYAHFYYFICLPEDGEAREEFRLIGMTSLIEAMMGDMEHKDVFKYFRSTYPNKNSIENFEEFKNEYLQKYGSTRKIVNYFQAYVSRETIEPLLARITIWDRGLQKSKRLGGVEDFAKFLYQMRSDFVHEADMQSFCDPKHFASLVSVGGAAYTIKFDVGAVMKMFEESFVKYWVTKTS